MAGYLYKQESFESHRELTEFLNYNAINAVDIVSITVNSETRYTSLRFYLLYKHYPNGR